MYLQQNGSRTRNCAMNEPPAPVVVVVDPTSRFTSQYSLAVKYYLHRNFNRSFQLVYPLVEELRRDPQTVGAVLTAKIVKIYFSLVSLLLNEVINLKLLKLSIPRHSLNFPDYLTGKENTHFASAILDDFNNGGLFQLVHNLHLAENEEIVLQCFVTEASNNLKAENLQRQVESYLSLRALFPGPITDSALGEDTLRKIMQFYLSQVVLKNHGVEKARNVIERLFVIDDEAVAKWTAWIDACDVNMRSVSSSEEEEDEDDDDALYASSFDDESDDQGYASDVTAITTNTTATGASKTTITAPPNGERSLASRTISSQSALTHTTLTDDSTRPEVLSEKASKDKKKTKHKGRSKSKSHSKSKSKSKSSSISDENSLIAITNNYMSRQFATFKDLVAHHLGRYPVVVRLVTFLVFLLFLLSKSSGSLQHFQLKKKLSLLFAKLVQTAQLAFRVSFL